MRHSGITEEEEALKPQKTRLLDHQIIDRHSWPYGEAGLLIPPWPYLLNDSKRPVVLARLS